MAGLADFRETVGIMTGASSGIGAQLARDLAARGMRVALLARRADRLGAVATEIRSAGGEAAVEVCDVAERASVERAVGTVVERWGRVDLLVNNAGYGRHVLFKDHDVADIERMMRTNYLGAVYATKAVLPAMRRRGRGWVVNVSSVAGKLGQPDEAAYSASKFAVAGLSEALSYELAPLGIHVMTVYPALIRTEMFTPEVMGRMPTGATRSFVEPVVLSRDVLHALARGRHEVTVPRWVAVAYVLRVLLPRLHRRLTARIRLSVLRDLTT
ncbi:MAG: SDR family NAD(P)-dependent oxidoreductase [Deltaproteobacteria bacterium]|nr:MAG: SDR family NAD(P)-dependent oxidoreductase [Deltaproteobacteria bacterium]